MYEHLEIRDETGNISRDEFVDYLFKVDNEYTPPISKSVNLNNYAEKLLDKANIITAREDDKLVGVCAFYCDEMNGKSYISTIGLLKDYKKRGIGKKLLHKAIIISKNKKMNGVSLEVNGENNIAVIFYRKHGFIISKEYVKLDLDGRKRKWKLMAKEI